MTLIREQSCRSSHHVGQKFTRIATIAIHDDCWFTYSWGVRGGKPELFNFGGSIEEIKSRIMTDLRRHSLGLGECPALNMLKPEAEWVNIDPRLATVNGETVIQKQWASGFFNTDLAQRLKATGADSIVMGGLTPSGCVRATAVDGLQNDYRVVVAREATGDRNAAAPESNLFDLQAKYADVMSLQDVLDCITQLPESTNAIQ